jgi:hypothetical protein
MSMVLLVLTLSSAKCPPYLYNRTTDDHDRPLNYYCYGGANELYDEVDRRPWSQCEFDKTVQLGCTPEGVCRVPSCPIEDGMETAFLGAVGNTAFEEVDTDNRVACDCHSVPIVWRAEEFTAKQEENDVISAPNTVCYTLQMGWAPQETEDRTDPTVLTIPPGSDNVDVRVIKKHDPDTDIHCGANNVWPSVSVPISQYCRYHGVQNVADGGEQAANEHRPYSSHNRFKVDTLRAACSYNKLVENHDVIGMPLSSGTGFLDWDSDWLRVLSDLSDVDFGIAVTRLMLVELMRIDVAAGDVDNAEDAGMQSAMPLWRILHKLDGTNLTSAGVYSRLARTFGPTAPWSHVDDMQTGAKLFNPRDMSISADFLFAGAEVNAYMYPRTHRPTTCDNDTVDMMLSYLEKMTDYLNTTVLDATLVILGLVPRHFVNSTLGMVPARAIARGFGLAHPGGTVTAMYGRDYAVTWPLESAGDDYAYIRHVDGIKGYVDGFFGTHAHIPGDDGSWPDSATYFEDYKGIAFDFWNAMFDVTITETADQGLELISIGINDVDVEGTPSTSRTAIECAMDAVYQSQCGEYISYNPDTHQCVCGTVTEYVPRVVVTTNAWRLYRIPNVLKLYIHHHGDLITNAYERVNSEEVYRFMTLLKTNAPYIYKREWWRSLHDAVNQTADFCTEWLDGDKGHTKIWYPDWSPVDGGIYTADYNNTDNTLDLSVYCQPSVVNMDYVKGDTTFKYPNVEASPGVRQDKEYLMVLNTSWSNPATHRYAAGSSGHHTSLPPRDPDPATPWGDVFGRPYGAYNNLHVDGMLKGGVERAHYLNPKSSKLYGLTEEKLNLWCQTTFPTLTTCTGKSYDPLAWDVTSPLSFVQHFDPARVCEWSGNKCGIKGPYDLQVACRGPGALPGSDVINRPLVFSHYGLNACGNNISSESHTFYPCVAVHHRSTPSPYMFKFPDGTYLDGGVGAGKDIVRVEGTYCVPLRWRHAISNTNFASRIADGSLHASIHNEVRLPDGERKQLQSASALFGLADGGKLFLQSQAAEDSEWMSLYPNIGFKDASQPTAFGTGYAKTVFGGPPMNECMPESAMFFYPVQETDLTNAPKQLDLKLGCDCTTEDCVLPKLGVPEWIRHATASGLTSNINLWPASASDDVGESGLQFGPSAACGKRRIVGRIPVTTLERDRANNLVYASKYYAPPLEEHPNCMQMDYDADACGLLIDRIEFLPCPTADAGTFAGRCIKPSLQMYTPQDLAADPAGFKYYHELYKTEQTTPFTTVVGSYVNGYKHTRMLPPHAFNQSKMYRIQPRFLTRFQFVHYCDRYKGMYVACDNDPLSLLERTDLCENGGGRHAYKASVVKNFNMETMCRTTTKTCYFFPGDKKYMSLAKFFASGFDFTGYTVYILPVAKSFIENLLLKPTKIDVTVINAVEDDPQFNLVPEPGDFIYDQGVLTLDPFDTIWEHMCGGGNESRRSDEVWLYKLAQVVQNAWDDLSKTYVIQGVKEGNQAARSSNARAWTTSELFPSISAGVGGAVIKWANVTVKPHPAFGGYARFDDVLYTPCNRFYVGAPGFELHHMLFANQACGGDHIDNAPVVLAGRTVARTIISDITVVDAAVAVVFAGGDTDDFEFSPELDASDSRIDRVKMQYTTDPVPFGSVRYIVVALARTYGRVVTSVCPDFDVVYAPGTCLAIDTDTICNLFTNGHTSTGRDTPKTAAQTFVVTSLGEFPRAWYPGYTYDSENDVFRNGEYCLSIEKNRVNTSTLCTGSGVAHFVIDAADRIRLRGRPYTCLDESDGHLQELAVGPCVSCAAGDDYSSQRCDPSIAQDTYTGIVNTTHVVSTNGSHVLWDECVFRTYTPSGTPLDRYPSQVEIGPGQLVGVVCNVSDGIINFVNNSGAYDCATHTVLQPGSGHDAIGMSMDSNGLWWHTEALAVMVQPWDYRLELTVEGNLLVVNVTEETLLFDDEIEAQDYPLPVQYHTTLYIVIAVLGGLSMVVTVLHILMGSQKLGYKMMLVRQALAVQAKQQELATTEEQMVEHVAEKPLM